MDNSNNNGLEYDDNSDMSDKKPHRNGFRNGFGVGIATGIVTTIVLGLIVLFAYTMITGRSVHTVAKSADVLDDKTVQKIDELALGKEIYETLLPRSKRPMRIMIRMSWKTVCCMV